MKYGFIRIAAAVPQISIGVPSENAQRICSLAARSHAQITVFPELSLTGCSCGDLFFHRSLTDHALSELSHTAKATAGCGLVFVGLPVRYEDALYDCAAAVANGKILGIVPKVLIPSGRFSMDQRWFSSGENAPDGFIAVNGENVPFGRGLLFVEQSSGVTVSADFGSTLISGVQESGVHAPADVAVCLASEPLSLHSDPISEMCVQVEARRKGLAIAYASAGQSESTAECVYSGKQILSDGFTVFTQSGDGFSAAVADIEKLRNDRITGVSHPGKTIGQKIFFQNGWAAMDILPDTVPANPYLNSVQSVREEECLRILSIQTAALSQRLIKTGLKKVIVGVSGGLDSTLVLLAAFETMRLMHADPKNVLAVTMPGFGTSQRTHTNADDLMTLLEVEKREIPIVKACLQHFQDIGQDPAVADVTYENAQARERTQILMDLANREGALVVGTGDLSEISLGWCTYNGDHMSMYGINASIPKTVIQQIIAVYARANPSLLHVLNDILNTPISPELKPSGDHDAMIQKTEDIVGSYELNDFFLYHLLYNGFIPEKILALAQVAFKEKYSRSQMEDSLQKFCERFLAQQFKRSCSPDGPSIGLISFSPRGGYMMPSDVSTGVWKNS